MTTNSTISDLERRVARAADESWLAAVQECHREGREVYPRDIIREHILPAALKTHAEWLAEQGLAVIPQQPSAKDKWQTHREPFKDQHHD